MNEQQTKELFSQLNEAELFHLPHAVNPNSIITDNYEVEFEINYHGELKDIHINTKDDSGINWSYSNYDFIEELAIALCEKANSREWISQLGIDYDESTEMIYWNQENKDSVKYDFI